MRFLRSNTAVIITVGPFYDKADGVTIETALTITNERITLTADTDAGSAPTNILDNITGATSATANDLNYITGNDAGLMQLELAAADVNRVGRMYLSITDAANHLPVFHEFMVLPQPIYDWFILGTIVPVPANVTTWLGTAAATPTVAGVPKVDLTHVAGATTNVSTLAVSVAAILVDTGTTLDAALAVVDANVDAILVDTGTTLQAEADAIQATVDHVTHGNSALATLLNSTITAIISTYDRIGAPAGATVSADIAAIEAQTDDIGVAGAGLTALATQTSVDNIPTNAELATALGTADDAVLTQIALVKTDTAAILVDTGTTLQGEIDGIQATLGAAGAGLTAVPYNAAWDAEIQSEVTDALTAYAPALETTAQFIQTLAADTNNQLVHPAGTLAALQTSVNEIPTNDDLATALAALNNLAAGAAMTLTVGERNAIADAYLARSLGTEAVSADNAVPTVAQAMFELLSILGEFSITDTTITCKKRDGTTTLFTSTLDSAATPTSRTRAT